MATPAICGCRTSGSTACSSAVSQRLGVDAAARHSGAARRAPGSRSLLRRAIGRRAHGRWTKAGRKRAVAGRRRAAAAWVDPRRRRSESTRPTTRWARRNRFPPRRRSATCWDARHRSRILPRRWRMPCASSKIRHAGLRSSRRRSSCPSLRPRRPLPRRCLDLATMIARRRRLVASRLPLHRLMPMRPSRLLFATLGTRRRVHVEGTARIRLRIASRRHADHRPGRGRERPPSALRRRCHRAAGSGSALRPPGGDQRRTCRRSATRDSVRGSRTKWTWAPDSLSIAFSLDPRARWHDGKPVTARRRAIQLLGIHRSHGRLAGRRRSSPTSTPSRSAIRSRRSCGSRSARPSSSTISCIRLSSCRSMCTDRFRAKQLQHLGRRPARRSAPGGFAS